MWSKETVVLAGTVCLIALASVPATAQEPVGVVVVGPGPISLEGTAPECPIAIPGGFTTYVGTKLVGKLFGEIVSINAAPPNVDFDLHVWKWNAGTLDCTRSPDGGFIVTSSRGASILGGFGLGSGAV